MYKGRYSLHSMDITRLFEHKFFCSSRVNNCFFIRSRVFKKMYVLSFEKYFMCSLEHISLNVGVEFFKKTAFPRASRKVPKVVFREIVLLFKFRSIFRATVHRALAACFPSFTPHDSFCSRATFVIFYRLGAGKNRRTSVFRDEVSLRAGGFVARNIYNIFDRAGNATRRGDVMRGYATRNDVSRKFAFNDDGDQWPLAIGSGKFRPRASIFPTI